MQRRARQLLIQPLASLGVIVCVLLSACSTPVQTVSPLAPSPIAVTTYAVIGDSLALGSYIRSLEATMGGRWLMAGVGSTTVSRDWQPDGSAYLHMQEVIGAQHVDVFLVHLSANDIAILRPTEDQMFSAFATLVQALQSTHNRAVVYVAEPGEVWTYGDRVAETNAARRAVERVWQLPNVRPGPMLHDLHTDDGVHFTSESNSRVIADRWLACLGR